MCPKTRKLSETGLEKGEGETAERRKCSVKMEDNHAMSQGALRGLNVIMYAKPFCQ